jgi:hypothetical protein
MVEAPENGKDMSAHVNGMNKAVLTEVVVVQVTVVVVTGSVVTITPAEWADVVDTLSDREMGTANPGMET